MGTRADFYVGRGPQAEWIGSIAYDGYPRGVDAPVKQATTEADFREAVEAFFVAEREDFFSKKPTRRNDVTRPADGWPWPWDDSRTTDYAYAFDSGKVHASCFGHKWFDPMDPSTDDYGDSAKMTDAFPDMSAKKSVTLGPRSGIMILGM